MKWITKKDASKFEIPRNKEKFVKENFNKIANKYNFFNDLITQWMHRKWKDIVVYESKVKSGDAVIDLCCGTGDITLRLAKKVGDSGLCVGVDFSKEMLDIAKRRSSNKKIIFEQKNVDDLSYENDFFDAVTIGYGLRNLENIDSCLETSFSMLKSGGRLVILDMGKVTLPLIKQLFFCYFFYIVPSLGAFLYPGEKMFNYFPASTLNFPGPLELASKLKDVGFKTVEIKQFHFGSVMILIGIK